ncbi:DNA translocase FtsK 4TM domain-containing protein, partial [uncultured Alistipes sp.]|uniref:DNA translocase FtsK 4TM domain-containing protein n=1 Tax=uncultured Alistipes sp. TaxID=538949 RepID=UPI002617C7B1
MATRKKKAAEGAVQPPVKGLSETQRWIYGFALLFFALFVLVSVVSFFIYWRDDQNIAQWSRIFSHGEQEVGNWGGKLGAVLAHNIVGGWFGLFGLCIPVALIILSLRIMRFRPARLRKSVRLTLILMILGSLSLGFLFGDAWEVFGSGLGGEWGILVARWLTSVLGKIGTGLLLLLSVVLYAIYVNRNTISMLNRVGREIVDNGKKVGEAVSATAAGIMAHEAKETPKKSAAPAPVAPVSRRNVAAEEDDDVFEVRSASDMTDDTPFYPGELSGDARLGVGDQSGRGGPAAGGGGGFGGWP